MDVTVGKSPGGAQTLDTHNSGAASVPAPRRSWKDVAHISEAGRAKAAELDRERQGH